MRAFQIVITAYDDMNGLDYSLSESIDLLQPSSSDK